MLLLFSLLPFNIIFPIDYCKCCCYLFSMLFLNDLMVQSIYLRQRFVSFIETSDHNTIDHPPSRILLPLSSIALYPIYWTVKRIDCRFLCVSYNGWMHWLVLFRTVNTKSTGTNRPSIIIVQSEVFFNIRRVYTKSFEPDESTVIFTTRYVRYEETRTNKILIE